MPARASVNLRIAAIEAIGSIRPEEAQDILFELKDSKDEDVAEAAHEALSVILPEDEDDEKDFEDDDEEDDE